MISLARLSESLEHITTIPVQDHSYSTRPSPGTTGLTQWKRCCPARRASPLGTQRFQYEGASSIPFQPLARTQTRLSTEAARGLDSAGFERLSGEIEEWTDLEGHLLARNHPEWSRSSITTADSARRSYDLVGDLRSNRLPAARDALFGVLEDLRLTKPQTVAEWERAVRFLAVAGGSWFARRKAQVMSREYREMREALNAPGKLSLKADRLSDLEQAVEALVKGLGALDRMAGLERLDEVPHTDLAAALERMASGRTTVANLPVSVSWRRVSRGLGSAV